MIVSYADFTSLPDVNFEGKYQKKIEKNRGGYMIKLDTTTEEMESDVNEVSSNRFSYGRSHWD